MKAKFLIVTTALAMTACSETSKIEEAVTDSLIDPESARIGEIIEYVDDEGDEWACIMVNAKNRLGGYTGEKMMLAVKTEDGSWQATEGIGGLDCQTWVDKRTSNS